MERKINLIMIILIITVLGTLAQSKSLDVDFVSEKKGDLVEITLTKFKITDKILELCYQIRNGYKHDIWICNNIDILPKLSFEVYLDEDNQTLQIRRRLDVPFQVFAELPFGRYIRMRPGEELIESLSFILPIYRRSIFWGGRGKRRLQDVEFARHLAVEIGFYDKDLPKMVRDILKQAEKKVNDQSSKSHPATAIKDSFGGLLGFNELNENLNMSEEVLIPYSHHALKGEKVIQLKIDDVRISYKEKEEWVDISPSNLRDCTHVEIQYQPSILHYFFPYAAERSLLSPEEIKYLRSLRTIISDDKEGLKTLANSISLRSLAGGIVRERNIANVVCYRDNERLTSFKVYNNETIVTEGKRFIYPKNLPSLERLTPPIKSFMLRTECAHNLGILLNRLNSCPIIEKSEMTYPALTEWCDAVVRIYRTRTMNDDYIRRPFKCPSVVEGKCHYAMNPNCKYDSSPDIVLLFETKAGWNQHGGPELFTFDNHDPKGGCVLLNDGTVKFIRTNEELQQLRWK